MTPTLTEFNPFLVPWQGRAITDIRTKFNYDLGLHEVMFSGSVGSAKSILLAHLVITHCLFNKGARVLIGRRSMPDLKDTIFQTVLEHLPDRLVEGKDYFHDKTKAKIVFSPEYGGSEIISRSWADKKYKKMRSLLLSMAVIEELTENDTDEFYKEIKMRVGRLPHIKENLIVCATNPDSPQHWAYKYFIESDFATRHVYYSVTTDNPFLPKTYIDNIRETLSPREARRMLQGEWLEISTEVIYYNYSTERNFIKKKMPFPPGVAIDIMFDFNIAAGKPMSAAVGVYVNNAFHVAKTYIIHGGRTLDIMEEMFLDGLFSERALFRVFGDAAGKHRDTRSIRSDYDIIEGYLKKLPIRYQMKVPKANPPVRTRHNKMNAVFKNDLDQVRFFVYEDAKPLDNGLRLTKLKAGSNYIEDDSFEHQHVTTAVGYWVNAVLNGAAITQRTHSTNR